MGYTTQNLDEAPELLQQTLDNVKCFNYSHSLRRIILLSLATLGVYYVYWFITLQAQIYRQTGQGLKPVAHILLSVFTGGIYAIVWHFLVGFYIAKSGGKNRWWLQGILFSVAFVVTIMFCITFLRSAIGIPTQPWLSYLIGGLTMFASMLVCMAIIQLEINKINSNCAKEGNKLNLDVVSEQQAKILSDMQDWENDESNGKSFVYVDTSEYEGLE